MRIKSQTYLDVSLSAEVKLGKPYSLKRTPPLKEIQ